MNMTIAMVVREKLKKRVKEIVICNSVNAYLIYVDPQVPISLIHHHVRHLCIVWQLLFGVTMHSMVHEIVVGKNF